MAAGQKVRLAEVPNWLVREKATATKLTLMRNLVIYTLTNLTWIYVWIAF